MSEKAILAVDACGGDKAPEVVLDGVRLACATDENIEILLCGPEEIVVPFCEANAQCTPCVAEEVIGMGEHPAQAVKSKKDSSIVVGCKAVKDGAAQGFFSAGSTGACLVAATLHIGRVKGVKRPALGIILPSYEKPTLLLDVGANSDVKVEYLLQFAQMGSAYMRATMNIEKPKVGLLNIGEEAAKGSTLAIDAHELLDAKLANFAGNAEPSDMMQGRYDVVVTDGFTGNIALKTIEATAGFLLKLVKEALMADAFSKIGALMVKGNLAKLKERINPDSYGGSPLLGINGVCMIGHGSSGPDAIMNGILASVREIRANVKDAIEESVSSDSSSKAGDVS